MDNRKGGNKRVNRRNFLKTGLGVAAGATLAGGVQQRPARAAVSPTLPSNDEMFGWVRSFAALEMTVSYIRTVILREARPKNLFADDRIKILFVLGKRSKDVSTD